MRSVQAWGRQVVHIWDRGFAHGRWLTQALDADVRFVLRWKKGQQLLDPWGEARKAWEIMRGQRSWEERWLWDRRSGAKRRYGVVVRNVTHPEHARPLWLVVARPGAVVFAHVRPGVDGGRGLGGGAGLRATLAD